MGERDDEPTGEVPADRVLEALERSPRAGHLEDGPYPLARQLT